MPQRDDRHCYEPSQPGPALGRVLSSTTKLEMQSFVFPQVLKTAGKLSFTQRLFCCLESSNNKNNRLSSNDNMYTYVMVTSSDLSQETLRTCMALSLSLLPSREQMRSAAFFPRFGELKRGSSPTLLNVACCRPFPVCLCVCSFDRFVWPRQVHMRLVMFSYGSQPHPARLARESPQPKPNEAQKYAEVHHKRVR